MSPNMQSKLLRALEEGRVRPVGSSTEVPFDARIVAATNLDVERELESGRFRQDLFYRINVVRIAVPPLRERGSDVLILAREFLADAVERNERRVTGMSEDVARALVNYPFPGNVRELLNVIERSVALTRHAELTFDDLPATIREYDGCLDDSSEASDPNQLLPLRELERRHIHRVLRATHGNKARAAKILGLDRRTLYRKLARESDALPMKGLSNDS
jgi:two-component system response regulator HydG